MGKVKEKKPDGGNPLGGIKLPDTVKTVPKELVQNVLDDGTMRIVSQLRDTAHQEQQEEYGGSQIENAALDVSRMTARGVEAFAKSKVETLLHPGNRDEDAPQEEQSEQDSVQKTGEDSGRGSMQESSAALSQETPPETVQELAQETPFTTETDTPHSTEEPVPESAGTFPEQSATSATQEQSPPTEQGRMESPKEPPTFGETFSPGEAAQPAEPLQSGETTVTETPLETSDRMKKHRKHHMEPEPVPEKKEETWKPAYQDIKLGKHGSTRNVVRKEPADEAEAVTGGRYKARTHESNPARKLERYQKSPKGRDGKTVGGQPEVREKGRKPVAQQDTAADLGRRKLIRERGKAAESRTADASWRETGAMQTVTLENHPARTPPGYTLNDGFSDVVPSSVPSYVRPSTIPDAVRHEQHPVEYQIPVVHGQSERNQQKYERPGIRTRADTTQNRNSPDQTEKEKLSVKSGERVKTRESVPQERPPIVQDTPQNVNAADRGNREFVRERGREIRSAGADSAPDKDLETVQRHDVPESPEAPAVSNVRSYPQTVHHQTEGTAAQTANPDITERAGIVKNKPIPTMDSGKPSSATAPVSATPRQSIAPEQETMPVKTREAYVQRENPSAQAVTHPAETASQTAEQGKAKAIRDAGQRTAASRAGDAKPEQPPIVSRTEDPIPVSPEGKQPEIVLPRQAQAVPLQCH